MAAGYEYVRTRYGASEASRLGRPLLQKRQACGGAEACIEQSQLAAIGQYQAVGAPIRAPEVAQGPTSSAPPPPPPPSPPRIETPKLKEARIFLEDIKKFISQQKTVSAISEIAKEAANLQLALNQYNESGAIESKKKLHELLRPIPGFIEFEQQELAERNREEARLLTEGRIQAKQNEFFIDTFLQGHLGAPTTQPLLIFADSDRQRA